MKKITSVFLSALMILASFCAVIPASAAPSGTPINTAEDFKNMSADGTYYLNADITLAETYATTFTGTLDGNGHTVTVSVPMFKQMNGTVKNLITVGEIDVSATVTGASEYTAVGAVAAQSLGGKYYNIANKADITVTITVSGKGQFQSRVGGIVGRLNSGKACIFNNCINEGDITSDGSTGGIVGGSYATGTVFDGCLNSGNITNSAGISSCFAAAGICGYNGTGAIQVKNCTNNGAIVSNNRAGGIVGDARKSATVLNCINNGSVQGSKESGGIVGYSGDSDITVGLTIINSINNGDVSGSGNGVGGIAGYAYAANKNATKSTTIENCINNGNVTLNGEGMASEFMAYSNSTCNKYTNLIGTGTLSIVNGKAKSSTLIFGYDSADFKSYTVNNVFLADGGSTEYCAVKKDWTNMVPIADAIGKDVSETIKSITRGELNPEFITAANDAIGSELFAIKNGKVAFKTLEVGANVKVPATGLTLGAVNVKIKETKQIPITSLTPVGTTDVITWTSADSGIATVVDGFVTGVSEGEVVITATLNDTVSATATVTVTRVPASSLELNASTLSVKAGATANLTATVLPTDTTDDVTWSSDNESVATVVGGVVTGVAEGTAKITAACGDFTAECVVTVESASCQHKNTITEGYHAPNHVKQWAGESGVTICLDCGEVISENVKLAPTAHKAGKTYTYDDKEHWKVCTYSGCTAEVKNTRGAHTYNDAGVCTVCGCGADGTLRGDLNADGKVTSDDAVYLLKHSLFGASQYPVSQNVDLNKDGKVTSDDAVYLLKYTLFGSGYPLD